MRNTLKDFYFTIDQRSIDLFRILLALVLIVDWMARWPNLEAFYSGFGVLPAGANLPATGGLHFSLLAGVSSLPAVRAVFLLGLLTYVLLLAGYLTRLVKLLVFFFFVAMQSRNLMVRNGGDGVLVTMLMWSLFLPMGRRFSVDAVIAAFRRGVRVDQRGSGSSLQEDRELSVAAFAILAQIGLIYFCAGVAKSGDTWRDGTALYYALNRDLFVLPLGHWLVAQPLPLIKLLTWGTLALEFSILPLILLPVGQPWLRRFVIFALTSLHVGIWLTMDLGTFPLVMIATYALLLSAHEWAWFAPRLRPVTVYYDDTCGFCHRCVQLLVIADRAGNLRFIGNHDPGAFRHPLTAGELETSLVVFDDLTGERTARSAAAATIFRALPLPFHALRVIALPGLRRVSDAIYDFVARHRYRFSAWLGFTACGIERVKEDTVMSVDNKVPFGARVAINVVVSGILVVVLVDSYNLGLAKRLALEPIPQTRWMRAMMRIPGIENGWNMFSPDPVKNDGWWVIDGMTELGVSIDPLTGTTPTFENTPNLGTLYGRLWRKYLSRITEKKNADYRRYFADYIIRQNHREKIVGDRLVGFDFYYVMEVTQPPGTPRPWPTERLLLWHQECPPDAQPIAIP